MNGNQKCFIYGGILLMGVLLAAIMFEVTQIAWRLDKCCPVKVEEQKTGVQQDDKHVLQSDSEFRAQLVRNANSVHFFDHVDQVDSLIWLALVPFAEVDEQCNNLPECTSDSVHISRPITVQTRNEFGVSYIAVLGLDVSAPQGRSIIPRITYYIGTQGGGLWRLQSDKALVEERSLYTNEWVNVEPASSNKMRDDIRTAFVNEWKNRYETQEL